MPHIKIIRHIPLLECVLATLMVSIMLPCVMPLSARAETSAQTDAQRSTNDSARDKSVVIYVSATDGSDQWSGRFPFPNFGQTDGPLASLDHAREVVRAIDKTGIAQILVLFRGGTYYVPSTVTFWEADSGTSDTEIVYRNFPGESPVFSGGVRVQNWVNVGGNRWQTALPASTQYFENLFYNGERRLRPRLGGYLGQYYHIAKKVSPLIRTSRSSPGTFTGALTAHSRAISAPSINKQPTTQMATIRLACQTRPRTRRFLRSIASLNGRDSARMRAAS
jgi:hypothetical protein